MRIGSPGSRGSADTTLRHRRLAGRGMKVQCVRKGIVWDLDLDEGIDLCIYLMGAYEPRIVRAYSSLIRPGWVVFDIGANIGAHTLHFARLVGPSGKVYAFEPTDYACEKIRVNLALNPRERSIVDLQQRFLVADGSERLPATVFSRWPVAKKHADLNFEHQGKPERLTGASAITADDFCRISAIQRLDFIKLDVDGHELTVLQGFRHNLVRFRPLILVELAPFVYKDSKADEFDDFVKFFADLGYDFTEAGSGSPIPSDPVKLRGRIAPGSGMNCLLYPPKLQR